MGALQCCPRNEIHDKSSLFFDRFSRSSAGSSVEMQSPTSVNLPILGMNEQKKNSLMKHFRGTMMEQRPDIFHKTMLLSMQSSPKLNEIIACQMYCYRDLTKWPKLNQLCQAQLNFYDRLINVLKLDNDATSEAVYALGIIHHRYAKYGLKPHFLDLWQQHMQTLSSKLKFPTEDEKDEYLTAFDELNSYITSMINMAYLKCQMEAQEERQAIY